MDPIFVKVKPKNPDPGQNKNADVNAIRLNVDYFKGRGIQLSVFPAEEKPNGLVMIVVTRGLYVKLEDASRLNRKRVDTWESLVRNQLSLKQGAAWDAVMRLCAEYGLSLDVEDASQAATA
jgi:hypothetical protein